MKPSASIRASLALAVLFLVATGARPPLQGCLDRAASEEAAGAHAVRAARATVTCPTCGGRAAPRNAATYATCPACRGTGRYESGPTQTTCGTCNGTGVVPSQQLYGGDSRPTCPTCLGVGRAATSTVKLANRSFYGPYGGAQLLRDEPGVVAILMQRADGAWTVVAAGATGNDGVTKWLREDPRLVRMRARLGSVVPAVAVSYERSASRQRKLQAAVLQDAGCQAPEDLE